MRKKIRVILIVVGSSLVLSSFLVRQQRRSKAVVEQRYEVGVAEAVDEYALRNGRLPNKLSEALTAEYGFPWNLKPPLSQVRLLWLRPGEWAIGAGDKPTRLRTPRETILNKEGFEIDAHGRVTNAGFNWSLTSGTVLATTSPSVLLSGDK